MLHRLLTAQHERRTRRRQRRMLRTVLRSTHAPCGNVTCACYGLRRYVTDRLEALR